MYVSMDYFFFSSVSELSLVSRLLSATMVSFRLFRFLMLSPSLRRFSGRAHCEIDYIFILLL